MLERTLALALSSLLQRELLPSVRDPICGKQILLQESRYTTQQMGRVIYFCSPGCKFTFKRKASTMARGEYELRKRVGEEARRLRNRSMRSRCTTCG